MGTALPDKKRCVSILRAPDASENPEDGDGKQFMACRFASQINTGLLYRAILRKSKEEAAKGFASGMGRAQPLEAVESSGKRTVPRNGVRNWPKERVTEIARLLLGLKRDRGTAKKPRRPRFLSDCIRLIRLKSKF